MQTIQVLTLNMTLWKHGMVKQIPRKLLYHEKAQEDSTELCLQWVSNWLINIFLALKEMSLNLLGIPMNSVLEWKYRSNFLLFTAKNPAPSKGTFASKPAAGGATRPGGRGGAQGPGRLAQQPSRTTAGAGGGSAALAQKDSQIQELSSEVCLITCFSRFLKLFALNYWGPFNFSS